jgi:hypothetical protein
LIPSSIALGFVSLWSSGPNRHFSEKTRFCKTCSALSREGFVEVEDDRYLGIREIFSSPPQPSPNPAADHSAFNIPATVDRYHP